MANAVSDWNVTDAAHCLQELAVVPGLADVGASHGNNCSTGHGIGHIQEPAARAALARRESRVATR
ncbi:MULTISPECIES: hypothetical protein [unclassified Streptomyces]|uniref:hypothetical protein n=1 Tax=unclassified Streptomyces TaxID=2593676 RepID=UPI002F90A794